MARVVPARLHPHILSLELWRRICNQVGDRRYEAAPNEVVLFNDGQHEVGIEAILRNDGLVRVYCASQAICVLPLSRHIVDIQLEEYVAVALVLSFRQAGRLPAAGLLVAPLRGDEHGVSYFILRGPVGWATSLVAPKNIFSFVARLTANKARYE